MEMLVCERRICGAQCVSFPPHVKVVYFFSSVCFFHAHVNMVNVIQKWRSELSLPSSLLSWGEPCSPHLVTWDCSSYPDWQSGQWPNHNQYHAMHISGHCNLDDKILFDLQEMAQPYLDADMFVIFIFGFKSYLQSLTPSYATLILHQNYMWRPFCPQVPQYSNNKKKTLEDSFLLCEYTWEHFTVNQDLTPCEKWPVQQSSLDW